MVKITISGHPEDAVYLMRLISVVFKRLEVPFDILPEKGPPAFDNTDYDGVLGDSLHAVRISARADPILIRRTSSRFISEFEGEAVLEDIRKRTT